MGPELIFGKEVAELLRQIPPQEPPHRVVRRLEQSLPGHLARMASALRSLRARAQQTGLGDHLPFLTSAGLEQATRPQVAATRIAELRALAPDQLVVDLTAGIGGDTLPLARAGLLAAACDLDPWTLRCARANLLASGLDAPCVRADALRPALQAPLALLDPDRRPQGRRTLDPESWSPPFSSVLDCAQGFEGACIKLAPGFDAQAADLGGRIHRWVWISLEGELRELGLWLGSLARGETGTRTALVLDRAGACVRLAGEPTPAVHLQVPEAIDVPCILEPDPAVIRSGLVGALAAQLGMAPLGPGLAFLGGERPELTPLGRSWRVLGSASADPRRVRSLLASHDVGPITVRKRGHPQSSEQLARRLRGRGTRSGHLLVARLARGHRAYLVERDGPG